MKKFWMFMIICSFALVATGFVVLNSLNKAKLNVLVYGVDGRQDSGESERSDAIMLINYNFKNNEMVVTSIPRDSYVEITCKNNEYDKINHAYAYGGKGCLNRTVSKLFGVSGVKNILMNFDSVKNIVDFFGLIKLVPNYSFCQSDEQLKNKYCFEKGKQILINGDQALAYMRNRKSLPKGDLSRIENQRQIFKTLINKVLELSNIQKISFYNYFKSNVETDLEIKDFNIKSIINVNNIGLREYTLKGYDYVNKYYYYKLDSEYLENVKKYYI